MPIARGARRVEDGITCVFNVANGSGSNRDSSEANVEGQGSRVDSILRDPTFAVYFDVILVVHTVPEKLLSWMEGCSCHDFAANSAKQKAKRLAAEFAGQATSCPTSGLRAAELAAGKHTEKMQSLLLDGRERILSLVASNSSVMPAQLEVATPGMKGRDTRFRVGVVRLPALVRHAVLRPKTFVDHVFRFRHQRTGCSFSTTHDCQGASKLDASLLLGLSTVRSCCSTTSRVARKSRQPSARS